MPIRASTTTDGIGPCDLVIIATKAFDVEAAAKSGIMGDLPDGSRSRHRSTLLDATKSG